METSYQLLRHQIENQAAASGVSVILDQPYAGTNNDKQMLDLYLPKERRSDTPLPVIVFIHGGAWARGDRRNWSGDEISLAATGEFATTRISHRLTGEAKWPAQIHDCKAAIRWIRANADKFGLDPDRIAVFGSSAGAHLASLIGTSAGIEALDGSLGPYSGITTRVACVVNKCGPQDFTLPLMFRNGVAVIEDEAVVDLMGKPVAGNREALVAASPITYVDANDPPFLTIHGTVDERVSFEHAKRIHAALTDAGVPSILIPVEGGGHGLRNPVIHERICTFLEKSLLGRDVEIPSAPLVELEGGGDD